MRSPPCSAVSVSSSPAYCQYGHQLGSLGQRKHHLARLTERRDRAPHPRARRLARKRRQIGVAGLFPMAIMKARDFSCVGATSRRTLFSRRLRKLFQCFGQRRRQDIFLERGRPCSRPRLGQWVWGRDPRKRAPAMRARATTAIGSDCWATRHRQWRLVALGSQPVCGGLQSPALPDGLCDR